MDAKQIYEKVNERYGSAAQGDNFEYGHTVAQAFGYTPDELASIPREANLGLSCGNPLALAKVKEGEIIIDLGSGAGLDVFLAAKKVGSNGKAIGVDMNKHMLEKANRNKDKSKAENVQFVESYITDIVLPDGIADCIVSNCVINLVPEEDKRLVFQEMFRLLKPRGRVAVSDILTKKDLPEEMKRNMELYVGCIAGASKVGGYEKYLREAGFREILIVDSKKDLNVYTNVKNPTNQSCCRAKDGDSGCCGAKDVDLNEWGGSFQVYAVKP